jgi:hypothetical protein
MKNCVDLIIYAVYASTDSDLKMRLMQVRLQKVDTG